MQSLFSRTIGLISVRVSNSYAAVRPAGPAPMMMAVFGRFIIWRSLGPRSGNLRKVHRRGLRDRGGRRLVSAGDLRGNFFGRRRLERHLERSHELIVGQDYRRRIFADRIPDLPI